MAIPITAKLLFWLHLLMFNNIAVVETKANISYIELIHGLIAIWYFISLANRFNLENKLLVIGLHVNRVLGGQISAEWNTGDKQFFAGENKYSGHHMTWYKWKICWLEQAQRRQDINGGPGPCAPPTPQVQVVLLTNGSRWNGSDMMHRRPWQYNLLSFHQTVIQVSPGLDEL